MDWWKSEKSRSYGKPRDLGLVGRKHDRRAFTPCMIFIGLRTRLQHLGSGHMHCPVCATTREYTRYRARNWFTLFFIPLFPYATRGEFVRCSVCAVTLHPSVLTRRAVDATMPSPLPVRTVSWTPPTPSISSNN